MGKVGAIRLDELDHFLEQSNDNGRSKQQEVEYPKLRKHLLSKQIYTLDLQIKKSENDF